MIGIDPRRMGGAANEEASVVADMMVLLSHAHHPNYNYSR